MGGLSNESTMKWNGCTLVCDLKIKPFSAKSRAQKIADADSRKQEKEERADGGMKVRHITILYLLFLPTHATTTKRTGPNCGLHWAWGMWRNIAVLLVCFPSNFVLSCTGISFVDGLWNIMLAFLCRDRADKKLFTDDQRAVV